VIRDFETFNYSHGIYPQSVLTLTANKFDIFSDSHAVSARIVKHPTD